MLFKCLFYSPVFNYYFLLFPVPSDSVSWRELLHVQNTSHFHLQPLPLPSLQLLILISPERPLFPCFFLSISYFALFIFWVFHVKEIMWYLRLYVWFLLINIMVSVAPIFLQITVSSANCSLSFWKPVILHVYEAS